MKFKYTEDYSMYESVLKTRIVDCLCKHVMLLTSDKSIELYARSLDAGYDVVMWGSREKLSTNPKLNATIQFYRIQRMIYKGFDNAVRIVIDEDGDVWIDNLHSAIRNVLAKGEDTTIGDMKCYIIDFSHDLYEPVVVNVDNSLVRDLDAILGAIDCGYKRLGRISDDIKAVHYTISDFMRDNDFRKDKMTITVL